MKAWPLLAIALFFFTPWSAFSKSPAAEKQRTRLRSLQAAEIKNPKLTLLEQAYLDASKVLADNNRCSNFFGGETANQILEEFVITLREKTFPDSRVGIRLSGTISLAESSDGVSYRLFENAEINNQGAFYRAKMFSSEPHVPNMGSFAPNTRQARVMILLHELAHLIKGRNGTWLIPDDGHNTDLSSRNTGTIESVCGEYIRGWREFNK